MLYAAHFRMRQLRPFSTHARVFFLLAVKMRDLSPVCSFTALNARWPDRLQLYFISILAQTPKHEVEQWHGGGEISQAAEQLSGNTT